MGLYGGYSFLLHKWFKDVKAFVNLEGTGAAPGTRSILFRTNSYELTNLMAYTPYPHVSILFNEMMRFVKSDTDYRPYSTLGRLPGIDIAFYSYRHLYHTPQDDIKHSHPISLQHMGDNLLAYIKTAGDIGLLLKLSQAPIVPDPQGNLPIPSFLYYDLYGFYFTVFNALTYKTLQTLLLLACLALGIGKLIIDGSYRSGVTSIYNQSFMPFIRAYLLIFLAVFSSIFFVLILSVLKCFLNPSSTYGYPGLNASWIIVTVLASFSFILWLKPVIENYFNVHQVDYTVILSSPILGREDVLHHSIHINSPSKVTLERDLLFNALIGFWTTLLIFSFLASAVFNMKATYFIFDWAFASIVAVVVIFAFNTIMTKWNPAVDTEDGNQDNNVQAFLVRVKATFIRHSWVLFFVSATIAPSLMTMDIFEEFMKAFPSLIAEGLSSIAVDVIFTLFTCLFLVNAIPPLMQCKTGSLTVTLCFLAIPLYIAALVIFPLTPLTPQKLAFSHSWNLNSNLSSVEFMVAPTMSQDSFTLWMKEWMPSLSNPSCVRHADKRDSTACTYSVGPPIFNGDKTKPMMSLDWMSVNESVVQANWTGSPDSRICSFSLNMIPGSDLSLHLDGNVLSSWKLIDGSRPRLETPVSDVTKPVLLMRREFTLSTRMNTTLLLVGNHRRLQSLSVKCYHSELENTFVSAVFKDLNQVKPDWLTFHHGRYGGISIEQDFPFTSTSHQLE